MCVLGVFHLCDVTSLCLFCLFADGNGRKRRQAGDCLPQSGKNTAGAKRLVWLHESPGMYASQLSLFYSRACRQQLRLRNGPLLIYLQICKACDATVALDARGDNGSGLLYTNCYFLMSAGGEIPVRLDSAFEWKRVTELTDCAGCRSDSWLGGVMWVLLWHIFQIKTDSSHRCRWINGLCAQFCHIASAERCLLQFNLESCL